MELRDSPSLRRISSGGCVECFEGVGLAGGLGASAGDGIAAGAVECFELYVVMVGKLRDLAAEHCFAAQALADFSRGGRGNALVRRAAHEAKRVAHVRFGDDAEKRRFAKFYGKGLA